MFDDYKSPHELYRQVYKAVSCGPTIGMKFKDVNEVLYNNDLPRKWGQEIEIISVSSIVEGCDEGTDIHTVFCYGKTPEQIEKEFWETVTEVNNEADAIWHNTHGCETCAAHWEMDFDKECGNIPIWLDCPDCGGKGTII